MKRTLFDRVALTLAVLMLFALPGSIENGMSWGEALLWAMVGAGVIYLAVRVGIRRICRAGYFFYMGMSEEPKPVRRVESKIIRLEEHRKAA